MNSAIVSIEPAIRTPLSYRLAAGVLTAALSLAAAPPVAAEQSGKAGCTLGSLPQSDRTPQTAAAARALVNSDPCKVVEGFNAKSITTVWNSLLSSSRTGGRRLEAPVPAGAPQGLTLPQRQAVHFDFSDVAGEQLRSLQVSVDQKPLANLANPPAQLDLPVAGFGPDQVFAWTLTTARGAYRAEFKLLPETDRQEVDTRLARLSTQQLDPVTKMLYTAAIYDEADLFAQRDRVLADIRRATGL